jgi:hypothetical protein
MRSSIAGHESQNSAPRPCKSCWGKNLFAFEGEARLVLRMKDDQHRFLSLLGQLPARLTAEQTGWVLNCQPHDIPALVTSRLLKPLGNPPANGIKFFCTADVLELLNDRSWLVKMTNTINQHWQRQNSRKKTHSEDRSQNGHSSSYNLRTATAA